MFVGILFSCTGQLVFWSCCQRPSFSPIPKQVTQSSLRLGSIVTALSWTLGILGSLVRLPFEVFVCYSAVTRVKVCEWCDPTVCLSWKIDFSVSSWLIYLHLRLFPKPVRFKSHPLLSWVSQWGAATAMLQKAPFSYCRAVEYSRLCLKVADIRCYRIRFLWLCVAAGRCTYANAVVSTSSVTVQMNTSNSLGMSTGSIETVRLCCAVCVEDPHSNTRTQPEPQIVLWSCQRREDDTVVTVAMAPSAKHLHVTKLLLISWQLHRWIPKPLGSPSSH